MLGSAILRTLAEIESSLLRINPHTVWVIGNQICLTRQPWDPKTVIRIDGQQPDERRGWMGGFTDRHMQFICRDHSQIWIAIFPPELVADRRDRDRVAGRRSSLDDGNHSCGRHE